MEHHAPFLWAMDIGPKDANHILHSSRLREPDVYREIFEPGTEETKFKQGQMVLDNHDV